MLHSAFLLHGHGPFSPPQASHTPLLHVVLVPQSLGCMQKSGTLGLDGVVLGEQFPELPQGEGDAEEDDPHAPLLRRFP